jgi:hypothetical protein
MKMKATIYLVGIALVISLVCFSGFVSSVKATPRIDESYDWDGTVGAYVCGTYNDYPTIPPWYYSVHHEGYAENYGVKASARFTGYDSNYNRIYVKTYGFFWEVSYDPPYYNQITYARSEVVIYWNYADALIGPPGMQ